MTDEQSNVQEQTMEQEEQTQEASEPKAIHHATKRGADMSLAKKEISQESHEAVLKGEIPLARARELGRSAGPDGPVGRSTPRAGKTGRTPTETPCLCGCGKTVPRTFAPGHDAKMHRIAREYVRGARELTDEQRQYVEQSGKLEKARARVADEEPKREQE